METGTKVLIGVVAAAGIGAAIYFGFIRKADEITSTGGNGGSGGTTPTGGNGQPSTPEEKSKLDKIKEEAKRKLKDAQCNLKFPPPRIKQEKKDAYRKCLHSADGSCGRNYSCAGCPVIAMMAADGWSS